MTVLWSPREVTMALQDQASGIHKSTFFCASAGRQATLSKELRSLVPMGPSLDHTAVPSTANYRGTEHSTVQGRPRGWQSGPTCPAKHEVDSQGTVYFARQS